MQIHELQGVVQTNPEKQRKFMELLELIQKNQMDYGKTFLLIAEEIKGKKTDHYDVPNLDELKQFFESFLHYK